MNSLLVSMMQAQLKESLAAIRELLAWEAMREAVQKAASESKTSP